MAAADLPPRDPLLVWAVVGAQLAPPFLFSGVAVALPALGAELDASATALGLVETTFLAGSVSFLLPFGRLADAIDRRLLFKLGLIALGALSAVIALSSWLTAILVLRFAQGMASAAFTSVSAAILADLVPPAQRGRVFGAAMGTVYAGLSLGPITAGWLVHLAGWRAVFAFGALLTLAGAALVSARLPSSWRRRGAHTLHLPSVALLVAAVLAVVLGCAFLRRGWPGAAAVAAGLALAVAFVRAQARIRYPLLDLGLLAANPTMRRALLAQQLLYLNAYCSMFLMSLYLQVTLGRSAQQAGLVLASGSLLMAMVAPIAGTLADRHGARAVTVAGIGSVLASSLLAALALREGASAWSAGAVLVLQGLGFGLFSSPNMATIMGAADPSAAGMASALAAKARSVGMVSGMLLTAATLSLLFGDAAVAEHPQRFVHALTAVYAVLAGTAATALWTAMRSHGPRPG